MPQGGRVPYLGPREREEHFFVIKDVNIVHRGVR